MYVDQNVLVLGLAKSGLRAAKLLHKLGARVTVNDMKPYEANDDVKELESLGIKLILGEHPEQLLEEHNIDIVVKNPGIPYTNPIVQKAASQNIPVITEVELAYQISEAEIIAITGSNGKTTTTTLIYEMLKADGKQPLLAGNIGNVACEVVQEATKEQIVVMEVSSFQLLGTIHFKPSVAVLLNIFNAHLDYHGTRENYMQAKGKIFQTKMTNRLRLSIRMIKMLCVCLNCQTERKFIFQPIRKYQMVLISKMNPFGMMVKKLLI